MKQSFSQSYAQLFTKTLLSEAVALERTASRVDANALEKVALLFEYIHQKKSTLVCSGVGKSGLVASKLASTFSSLGLPSSFLHPVDALHGDLGRIREDDAFLFISKSGTTEELLSLIPYLPIPKERIVGLLGHTASPLSQCAGITIDCSVEREACLNNQAPTTSTTVALAVGDALAVIFESLTGLSKEGFAVYHPAGFLGKSLTLRVSDLMIPASDCPCLDLMSSCREVIIRMTERPVGLCAILSEGELLGIVVDGDIRRLLSKTGLDQDQNQNQNPLEFITAKMMNAHPVTIQQEQLAYDALGLMELRERQITALPVLSGKKFVGIIRLHDLIRAGLLSSQK